MSAASRQRKRMGTDLGLLAPPAQLGGMRVTTYRALRPGMTAPATQAGRAQLVEAAGMDSDIDADYAARILEPGSFFWLDLSGVPPERMVEFSVALGLNADALQHLVDRDQRSSFTETQTESERDCIRRCEPRTMCSIPAGSSGRNLQSGGTPGSRRNDQ